MSSFLEQYGVAIFTLVLMAILIAFAGPMGLIIKKAINTQVSNISNIGTEEIDKRSDTITDNQNEGADYVYAYLDKNGELVISANDLNPSSADLYDSESNFGKCVLKNDTNISVEVQGQDWNIDDTKALKIKSVRFENIVKPNTCQEWFIGCENLTEIKNITNLDTSACTNMEQMFWGCKKITTLNLNSFDTSNVTNMLGMFCGCQKLTNLNAKNWNCENVTNMAQMFMITTDLTTLDLSGWKISNPNTNLMFATATYKLNTITCSQDVHDKLWNNHASDLQNVTWIKSN